MAKSRVQNLRHGAHRTSAQKCVFSTASLQCVNGRPAMVMHQTIIRNVVSDVKMEMHTPCDCSALSLLCQRQHY
eukprot:3356577-Amphidinium_carterae.1